MTQLRFAIGLLMTVACSGLYAQTIAVRADIPFDFRVGDTAMPAGQYQLNYSSGVLIVRSADRHHRAAAFLTIPTIRSGAPAKGELVFNRYGAAYFLANVWSSDSTTGRALRRSAVEKEFAASASSISSVAVALRRN